VGGVHGSKAGETGSDAHSSGVGKFQLTNLVRSAVVELLR